jgi:hypothetical protein
VFNKLKRTIYDIKMFFNGLKAISEFTRQDVIAIRREMHDPLRAQFDTYRDLRCQQAAIIKTLSSIELELVMLRGGCADNNFPSKEEMP